MLSFLRSRRGAPKRSSSVTKATPVTKAAQEKVRPKKPWDPDAGFIFATTGAEYTDLARRAARTLRLVMPDAQVDLFTDQAVTDDVFDQIHDISHRGLRPKMEALLRSRFEKTVYLDADIVVLEDICDIFELMEFNPIIATPGVSRKAMWMNSYIKDIPNGFPIINSGVLGIRKNEFTTALMQEWDQEFSRSGSKVDQPVLRGLLYQKRFIPLMLQQEYNLIKLNALHVWRARNGALRCLHVRDLHNRKDHNPHEPISLREIVGEALLAKMRRAREFDTDVEGPSPAYDLPSDQNPVVKDRTQS